MLLDLIQKTELPDDMKGQFFNELQALANIWRGMSFIYKSAQRIEQRADEGLRAGAGFRTMPPEARKAFEGKDVRYFSAGNDPALASVDKGLLYSLFQWYAVSACSYVRLVGYVAKKSGASNEEALAYVEKVIPKVKWFRDKIAAHPVRSSKESDRRDNEADRFGSVLYQVAYDSGRFYAPSWQVNIRSQRRQTAMTSPGPWSITQTHEELRNRYRGRS